MAFRPGLLPVAGLWFQLPACWQGHRPCSGSPPHSATAPESVATCDVELQPSTPPHKLLIHEVPLGHDLPLWNFRRAAQRPQGVAPAGHVVSRRPPAPSPRFEALASVGVDDCYQHIDSVDCGGPRVYLELGPSSRHSHNRSKSTTMMLA